MLLETSTDTTWQDPTLFHENINPSFLYPIEALPSILLEAIQAYHPYGQQPISLIAGSAIANMSLACQTLANVARDRLLISPVSLYFLTIASSGERKTGADIIFGEAIRAWEEETKEELAPSVQRATTLHQAWRSEKAGLLLQIRRSLLMGENVNSLKRELVALMEEQPEIPLLPTLYFEDTTQEALAMHLAQGWPSSALWSDEGGIVLNGHGMQNNATKFIALLNRLWDGKHFITHRKTSDSFTISHRRFTLSLMLQPLILDQLLAKEDGICRQSGFLARNLLSFPSSKMGQRYYQEPHHSLLGLDAYQQRIKECLEESLPLDRKGCHAISTLSFSENAKRSWVNFFNQIESGLLQQWSSIKDFASKAPENVARLAALFHLFQGKEQSISPESVEQAIQIIHWHLTEARRVLTTHSQTEQQQKASKLLNWLLQKDISTVTSRYLQQYSPLRDKKELHQALQLLSDHHCIKETKDQGKSSFQINPALV